MTVGVGGAGGGALGERGAVRVRHLLQADGLVAVHVDGVPESVLRRAETRLAQNTLNYIRIVKITLRELICQGSLSSVKVI